MTPNAIFRPVATVHSVLEEAVKATITKTNGDGTVNLTAHDGNETPHVKVPLITASGLEPAVGFWAKEVKAAAPPAPAARKAAGVPPDPAAVQKAIAAAKAAQQTKRPVHA